MHPVFKRLYQTPLFKLLVKAGLTLTAFWFVFHGVDFAHLYDILQKQDHTVLFSAVFLLFLQAMLGAFRWRLIINSLATAREHILSAMAAIKIYYIGVFFTCCLPGTVGGDVVRVWLAKSEHVPLPMAINSVIIDRMIALAALAVMVLVTLPILGKLAGFSTVMVFPLTGVAVVIGVYLLFNIDRLLAPYRHIRIIHWLLYFTGSLRIILTRRFASVISLAFAIVAHLCYCFAAYQLAQSLSIHITFLQCITLVPPVMLAAILPISIGGWGVREAGMIGMFKLIGVHQAAALMLSIQLGILCIVVSLPGSLLWLVYRKRSPRHGGKVDSGATGSGQ